jgi:hypothetical protein
MNIRDKLRVRNYKQNIYMNVAIFWDIELCNPYVIQGFGGMYYLDLQGQRSAEHQAEHLHELPPQPSKHWRRKPYTSP